MSRSEIKNEHVGLNWKRLNPDAGNPLEQIYAIQWQAVNRIQTGQPTPLLAHLLNGEFSERDAQVAATVVQWLGSYVGRSFVQEGLRKESAYRCSHNRLDEDGVCRECGTDRRGA